MSSDPAKHCAWLFRYVPFSLLSFARRASVVEGCFERNALELTETASASISVFHSSIVKVPAQHDLMLRFHSELTSSRRLKADGMPTFASGIFLVP